MIKKKDELVVKGGDQLEKEAREKLVNYLKEKGLKGTVTIKAQ
jgi:ribosome biogenesis GTPase A